MSSPVVLINVFEVPAGTEHAFVAWWEKSSEVLKQEPGFIDAMLHRSLKPGARFQFINIAHWETAEALDIARARNADVLQMLVAGKGTPAVYEIASQY
jgi:heme oxygenase (mycobilin-producing)